MILCLSVMISGCDNNQSIISESGRFYFTNDTSDSFIFFMDYHPIVVPNQSVGSLLLKPGVHVMITTTGEPVQFIVYPGNKGGILNPTQQFYYAYNYVYGTEGIPSLHHLNKQSLVVGHYQLSGRINSSNDYIIDNNVFNCDIPVGEQAPEALSSSAAVSQVKTKCLTHKELTDLIHRGDAFISQLMVKKVPHGEKQSVTVHFDYPLTTPNFTDEVLQMYAQEVVGLVNRFRHSLDPQRKQFYYNEYHNKISHMAVIYSQMRNDGTALLEKCKYAEFMQQTRAIFGAGILMM